MLVRTLAAAWLLVAAAGAAPAAAQVVETPHWLAAVTASQSCDRHAGEPLQAPDRVNAALAAFIERLPGSR